MLDSAFQAASEAAMERLGVPALEGGLRVDAVEIDVCDGARTPYPPLRARPIGKRTYVFLDGPMEHSRFDFLPAEGPPRFARVASRLAERVP